MSSQPRTCIGCRKPDVRTNLIRMHLRDSSLVLDDRTGVSGRGAWIHPESSCVDRAIRSCAFDRAFKQRGVDISAVGIWREKVLDGTESSTNDKESG